MAHAYIVVPHSLQEEILQKIHQGHFGVQKCLFRARTAIWWPGLSSKIKILVHQCKECAGHSILRREPLIPSHTWQKVGADLFHLNGENYLLVVDYFSWYPEVVKLTTVTSQSMISALKSVFLRHGILEILWSDNYLTLQTWRPLPHHMSDTSSPRYPQSNGSG